MVVEPAGVATNGFGVGAFGTLVVLAPSQHVALERVEQRLAGRDRDGPLRQLHGLGGIAIAERLAPFIVSLVGWLGAFEPGDGLLVAVAPDLTAVTQFGQQLAVVVDSFATRWMRGEQRREHVLAPAFGQAQEGFLQFHSPARVVAGALHVAHSVQVRFAFGVARVALVDQLRADHAAEQRRRGIALVVGGHARRDAAGQHRTLQQNRARLALGAVACGRMHDLVAEHGSQFGLAVHFGQQAAVDRDLAARQRPGIRYRVVDHIEFVGKLPVRHRRQPLTDPLHVVDQGRVECEVAALGLT